MKLFTALKKKNRLVGEVVKLSAILGRENSKNIDSTSKVQVDKIYEEWVGKKKELSKLKAFIAKSNVGIFDKMFLLEELKSQIAALDALNTKDGKFWENISFADKPIEKVYIAYITNEKRDALKQELQQEINDLQDKIDEYNVSTDLIEIL